MDLRYDLLSGQLLALSGGSSLPGAISSPVDPTAADNSYPIGQIWVNTTTKSSYILVDLSGGNATWNEIGSAITPLPRVALDIVDCTLAPPTIGVNDTYVLDNSGAVNAAWGGASQNDIVMYTGSVWSKITPVNGTIITLETPNIVYIFENVWSPLTDYLSLASTTSVGVASFKYQSFKVSAAGEVTANVPTVYTVGFNGRFPTITAAINQFMADGEIKGVIQIEGGTYTENVVLRTGIYLSSVNDGNRTECVKIIGNVSFSEAGEAGVSGIKIQNNAGNCISVTGVDAAVLRIENCTFVTPSSGVDGIRLTNANAKIITESCTMEYSGTTRPIYVNGGDIGLTNFTLRYTGSGSSIICGNGTVTILGSIIAGGIENSGAGIISIYNSSISSGTSSCIIHTSTDDIMCFNAQLDSSAASGYAVTGTGNFKYSNIIYLGSAKEIDTAINGGIGEHYYAYPVDNRNIIYDNSGTNLNATNLQDAIDELNSQFFRYEIVTGTTQVIDPNKGYLLQNSGLVSLTLPTTCKAGSRIDIIDDGLGGWEILQNPGQIIYFNSYQTTAGIVGKATSTENWNSITLVCKTDNTEFLIVRPQGTIELT